MARLVAELVVLAPPDGPCQASEVEKWELTAAAVADAWTFVDAAFRFKRFLHDRKLPRPPGPPPTEEPNIAYNISGNRFREAVKGLRELRDRYQHLDVYAPQMADAEEPVWGDLAWITYDEATERFNCNVLVTATPTTTGTAHNFINPVGKAIQTSPDLITLTAFGQAVNLCEIHRAMTEYVADLSRVMALQFDGLPVNDSSMVMTLQMAPVPDP